MIEDDQEVSRRLARIGMLVVLLLSPAGAPAIGFSIIAACTEGWESPLGCGIPKPLIDYFMLFTFAPFIWGGAFIGILWCLIAVAITVALLGHLCQWLWSTAMNCV